MNANLPGPHHVGVLIIGAGFSGLGAAIALQKDGYTRLSGGRAGKQCRRHLAGNTYPGAACDVPSHLYSYSFAPNPNWTRSYSKQPEIQAYIQHVARQYECSTNTGSAARSRARAGTRASAVGRRDHRGHFTADFVVSAVGRAVPSRRCRTSTGIEDFAGEIFHSAAGTTTPT